MREEIKNLEEVEEKLKKQYPMAIREITDESGQYYNCWLNFPYCFDGGIVSGVYSFEKLEEQLEYALKMIRKLTLYEVEHGKYDYEQYAEFNGQPNKELATKIIGGNDGRNL